MKKMKRFSLGLIVALFIVLNGTCDSNAISEATSAGEWKTQTMPKGEVEGYSEKE